MRSPSIFVTSNRSTTRFRTRTHHSKSKIRPLWKPFTMWTLLNTRQTEQHSFRLKSPRQLRGLFLWR